jgi:soluble lytic murein transglycosylase-like protein
MPNWMILRVNQLWRIGLIGISLWIAPHYLWSQKDAPSEHAPSSADRTFAELGDSLTRAADTLLVSGAQSPLPVIRKADTEKSSVMINGKLDDLRTEPGFADGKSAAAVRVNLLRPMVEPILRNYGVPAEFVAVITVESGGQTLALSPKGARGLWQLMPDTARRYGLRVDEIRDDRLDLLRATDTAARYLHDLYTEFGDWKLVLAAYNTGEINVSSAILRAHSKDFDQLANLRMLPLETRNYVPRVLAAARYVGPFAPVGDDHRSGSAINVFALSSH